MNNIDLELLTSRFFDNRKRLPSPNPTSPVHKAVREFAQSHSIEELLAVFNSLAAIATLIDSLRDLNHPTSSEDLAAFVANSIFSPFLSSHQPSSPSPNTPPQPPPNP